MVITLPHHNLFQFRFNTAITPVSRNSLSLPPLAVHQRRHPARKQAGAVNTRFPIASLAKRFLRRKYFVSYTKAREPELKLQLSWTLLVGNDDFPARRQLPHSFIINVNISITINSSVVKMTTNQTRSTSTTSQ